MPRTSDAVVVAAVAAVGIVAALVDMRSRRLPNSLTLGIATVGVMLAALRWSGLSVPAAMGGLALGLVLMLPGHLLGATGGGDVKLFAATGTLLGPQVIVVAFLYTVVAGGVIALLVAALRRRLRDTLARTAVLVRTGGANVQDIEHGSTDNRFPYAPAIAVGTLVAALGF